MTYTCLEVEMGHRYMCTFKVAKEDKKENLEIICVRYAKKRLPITTGAEMCNNQLKKVGIKVMFCLIRDEKIKQGIVLVKNMSVEKIRADWPNMKSVD